MAIYGFRRKGHKLPDQCFCFLCTVRGHAFIDRELYLPKVWIDDRARLTKEHVLKEMMDRENSGFATKPALTLAMIERPLATNAPFYFVAADTVYGVGDIEMALRRVDKGYLMDVRPNDTLYSRGRPDTVAGRAKEIANHMPPSIRKHLSAGCGTKGAQLHDWAF